METKRKEVENTTMKLESKDNIAYPTENTERNNRQDSTGKNRINNRMQNVGETIEGKVPTEMTNIQTKAKQQKTDVVANKASNGQQQKKQQVLDKKEKNWINQNKVIMNRTRTRRPITLEVLVQKRKLN